MVASKTPPCVDKIISSELKIYISIQDPDNKFQAKVSNYLEHSSTFRIMRKESLGTISPLFIEILLIGHLGSKVGNEYWWRIEEKANGLQIQNQTLHSLDQNSDAILLVEIH